LSTTVSKRNVFYVGGFDPRGARFYHGLYRKAADQYNTLTGEGVVVSRRDNDGWSILNEKQGTQVEYTFLQWDDLVRKAWIRNPAQLVWRSLIMYVDYLCHSQWPRIVKMAWPPLVTLFYPLLSMVLLPLLLSLLFSFVLPWWLALPAAGGATLWLLVKLKVLWLMRFFVFNHRMALGKEKEIDARLDEFADVIVRSFENPADETLLVCHSNGSILAVPLLEKIAARTGGNFPSHFAVLTLGHCIPLLRDFSKADAFKQHLVRLAEKKFTWVDISFPPDGAAYAFENPFGGMEHEADVTCKSPQFYKYYDEKRYKKMRRNKYQLHFAYLQTGDSCSPLDYVRLTTSPQPLVQSMGQL
jgi:hypothetical protein